MQYQEHLEKVLASPAFARADRQARLLRYLVERSAEGRAADLKEYTIALEVFDRAPDYDPKVDSVVRVEASKLRARLEKYYASNGGPGTIRFTIPKGSYSVEFHGPKAVPPKRRPYLTAALVTAAVACVGVTAVVARRESRPPVTPQPSIAVLSFSDLGPSRDPFGNGLTEEITSALSRLHGVKVVSRTSASQFDGRKVDIREIGRQLNVHAVLEGTVRKDRDRTRITAELVETAGGFTLWSESWEQDTSDVLDAQRQVAGDIVNAFRKKLLGARRALVLPRGENPEAYQQYLRASLYAIQDEPEAMNHAVRLFKLSVAADPNYALGWAGVSRQLIASAEQELAAPRDVCAPAHDARQRALRLNDDLVEAHLASAWYDMLCEWNWNAAEREFRRAIDLDPSYLLSLHDYGRLLVITGRFNEAAAAFNRALEADRGWNWLLNGLANAHLKAGRFDEAMRYLDASCGLEALPGCLTRRGMVLAAQGRHQDAIAHYQQSLEKQPHSTWTNGHYGYSLAHLGRRKEAEALITSLSNSPLRQVPEFEIAAIHSGLGSREVALDWLERAHGRRSPTVMYSGVDFRFQSLRGERRFQDLLRKLNLH